MDQSNNTSSKLRFTLKKAERNCSVKQKEKLFSEGKSFLFFPIKVIYTPINYSGTYPSKSIFAVSKKIFKKAVQRNRIKRLLRESYRLNKHLLNIPADNPTKFAIIFIYIGKKLPDYQSVENSMRRSLKKISRSLTCPDP